TGNVGSANVPWLNAGGLVSDNNGSIFLSMATGNVRTGDNGIAGGLVASTDFSDFICNGCTFGAGFNTSGSVSASIATGDVTAGPASLAGGLAGSAGPILASVATGNVTGGGDSALGGLVGYLNNEGFVFGSFATGNVTSTGPV